ncbi:MAG TPA: NapC/NirT family cytochrome c [Candidatus Limnocylindrales bacterium]|nr:NapC/NirT family cytochrome c [Candidatus Limnocylindrales bacterium]
MTSRLKIILLFVILIVPAVLSAVTTKLAFSRAERVEFCASCHTMTPWINDVTGADGDSLAHEHFSRRLIQHDQCYTCHSDYGFLGPLQAKLKGVRHLIAFYIDPDRKVELYGKFPNANCLQCHAEGKAFLEDSNHEPVEDLLSGKDLCVDCHDTAHNVEQDDDAAVDAAPDGDGDDKEARKVDAVKAADGNGDAGEKGKGDDDAEDGE